MQMSDREVIAALGGVGALRQAFGYKPERIKAWLRNGIPWIHRGAVARVAAEKGIDLPADFRDERRVA